MDIRKLQYFISVAETLSFTKAAKNHYISQTAMSQQIASIETELEVVLFNRSKQKVSITPAGEVLLRESKEIVSKYDQAVQKTKYAYKRRKGCIRIGYAGPTEVELLRKIIEVFQEKYPCVELHIESNNFKKLSKKLKDGNYDVIFTLAGEIDNIGSIEKVTLKNESAILVVSKKHPKANTKVMDALEVADEEIIMLSEECGQLNFERMFESCRRDGYEPNIIEKVNSLDTLIFMVELNRGVSFLPKSHIKSLNNNVSFIEIINTHHSFAVEMSWVKSNTNEYIKEFITITRELFSSKK